MSAAAPRLRIYIGREAPGVRVPLLPGAQPPACFTRHITHAASVFIVPSRDGSVEGKEMRKGGCFMERKEEREGGEVFYVKTKQKQKQKTVGLYLDE